jgi:hypothetical protein
VFWDHLSEFDLQRAKEDCSEEETAILRNEDWIGINEAEDEQHSIWSTEFWESLAFDSIQVGKTVTFLTLNNQNQNL